MELIAMDIGIWIALAAALMSCYFAACTIALRSYSKSRLFELLDQKSRADRYELFVARAQQFELMANTLRTCFNMIVLLAVIDVIARDLPDWAPLFRYILAFAIAGGVISVLGVAIPISLARYHPEKLLANSTRFLTICLMIFKPLASFLHLFDPIVRRISGGTTSQENGSDLGEEILSFVEDHEDQHEVDEAQKGMLEAVMELPSTTAGRIMTPRIEVQGIETGSTLEQVKHAILSDGHSRMPVYEQDIDHIVGILYAKDLLKYLGGNEPFNLRSLLREPFMVPESKPIRELLAEFKSRKVHMAIVLDEYGGTAGLVTIEDIIEEIVGDIADEYEPVDEHPRIHRIDANTVEVDARVYIDDLNDALDLELPEDEDYDTVGGFVIATLGHIPEVDESFEWENIKLTIIDAERNRVNRVRVQLLEPTLTPESESADESSGK